MDQTLLSDLCSICYTEKPKYRCPRCKTQTCSLSCYKRHQQRASCSGKRDPAAYLKKSQLATPASIDRDYNYLKSVEKDIDHASADARERGVGRQSYEHPQSRIVKREGAFQRYLAQNGITVEYAPKGLSRQKNNHSRITKNDKVFWTVEWRGEKGEQDLRQNADEGSTLQDLFKGVQVSRRKRKAGTARVEGDGTASGKKLRASTDTSSLTASGADLAEPGQKETETSNDGPTEAIPEADHDTQTQADGKQPHSEQQYFYLLRPSTGTQSKVLVPLDPSATLTAALKGQTVQEYPTIYVLHSPPDSLPEGFVSVDDYRASLHTDIKVVGATEQPSGPHGPGVGAEQAEQVPSGGDLDANAILDMLKRDIRA